MNINGIDANITRAVQEGIGQNDIINGLFILISLEQELNYSREKIMNKIDEKFKAASSQLLPAIDDEKSCN